MIQVHKVKKNAAPLFNFNCRYWSIQSGKWHAGASCQANLPVNRGFNRSIGYLSGAEDHYTQTVGSNVDLWQDDAPAYGKNGTYGGYSGP